MTDKLTITPLGPHIGAVIAGVNLAEPLSQGQFEQLHRALLKYQVLFFRNQPITPRAQRALANRFGDLHIHPVYPHTEEAEEIIVLDTHDDNPPDNDNWHTDVTFIETPPALAILAAKQLPPTGGDTLWASGIAALAALSPPLQTLLAGLEAEHDFTKSFPAHRHDDSEGFTTRLPGLPPKESDALLGFLFEHITRPEFQVRWRWQENDIAIWDNRVTQHYANADYLPARRVMHRATILGDKPFWRPG
ncbi:TauD/TfdA family dioxygenase [Aeromonas caviae]|uniref:TauD/TfdA family dioxygenase n=1 Tax=Aeromonas caviae TaxID=648 RepID=UPI003EC85839